MTSTPPENPEPATTTQRRTPRTGLTAAGIVGIVVAAVALLIVLIVAATTIALSTPQAQRTRDAVASALGFTQPRSWLVLLQNPAEARGGGGLIGGYVVVNIDHGRPTVTATGTSADLEHYSIPPTNLDPDQLGFWGPALMEWSSVNVTPDFPVTAALARDGMAQMGIPVDGVIAVDPTAVSTLMRITGPVTVNGRTVDADSIARIFMVDEYIDQPNPRARDSAGMDIVKAVSASGFDFARAITSPTSDGLARLAATATRLPAELPRLIPALASLVTDGHVHVWSADPMVQAQLVGTPLAGSLPNHAASRVDVAFNNAAGNKADAFVTSAVDFQVDAPECAVSDAAGSGADSDATTVARPDPGLVPARVTVTLRNDMPLGLPIHDYGRRDTTDAPAASTAMLVHVFGPSGTSTPRATLNGGPVDLTVEQLKGRPVWWTFVELPRGQAQTLTIAFLQPAPTSGVGSDAGELSSDHATATPPPTVGVTPMANPARVTTGYRSCPGAP